MSPYIHEVLVHGTVGLGFLFYFVRKAYFPIPLWQFMAMGVLATMIPGGLMQLACLYDPEHALSYHYSPALYIGGFAVLAGFGLQKFLQR